VRNADAIAKDLSLNAAFQRLVEDGLKVDSSFSKKSASSELESFQFFIEAGSVF